MKKLREISLKNENNAKDADTILTPIKQSFFSIKPRPFPFRFKGTNPVLIQLHAIVKQPKLKNCLRHLLYSDFSSFFFPISKFQKIQIIDEKSKFFFSVDTEFLFLKVCNRWISTNISRRVFLGHLMVLVQHSMTDIFHGLLWS